MENNIFDELKQLDDLSELKTRIDDRYKPIVDAKIAYRLKKIHKPVGELLMRKASGRSM